jgi:hypothetical protein
MFRILAIAAALLGLASIAQADVWKWTDPNGTIHYSDNWVPGSVLVKTDARGSSAASAPEPAAATDPAQDARDKRSVATDVAKAQADQCKKARETYDKAVTSRRISRKGANGETQFLSDAEMDAYRLQLLNARKQLCGS